MTVWRLVGLIFLAQLSDLMWIEPTNNSTTVGMTPTTPAYRNTPLQPFSTSSNETVNEYPCGVNLDFRGDVGTVTGGEETEKHEYPWMVYVCGEYNYEYEEVSISDIAYDNTIIKCNEACGGTLISTKHVLTAAHCVAKSSRSIDNTYVLLGAHNIQESREYAYLSAIHIFPGYKKDVEREYRNSPDVAILELEDKVTFGPDLNRVCLPTVAESMQTHEGIGGRVSGWGLTQDYHHKAPSQSRKHLHRITTEVLHKAFVTVISNSKCKSLGNYSFLQR